VTIDERIEALTARHEALTERHEALTMNVQMMQAAQADIHANHHEIQNELKMVLRSQVLMSESLNKLSARMTELAEAQRHTDQRMDALILTVDEIVRGRNGGPKVPEA